MEEIDRSLKHLRAIQKHWEVIYWIKIWIRSGEYSEANEAWKELSWDEQISLWVAQSKGGIFTTEERKIIKSAEFRES